MEARRSWRSKAKFLPLAVPLFGIAELGAHWFFSRRAPAEKDWSDVRPVVASWRKPGAVVVVAPYWAEPMARWSFGDALMPTRDVARPDVTRYAEALEISTLGNRSPELAGWKVLREGKQGSFTLRALSNPSPPAVTYDFVDRLGPDAVDVSTEKAAVRSSCAFTSSAPVEGGGLGGPPIYPASRFVCPAEPSHVFVGVTIVDDEQARPRRCIWAHPPAGESEIVARFRAVPLGTKIHGHLGMGWLIERDRGVPPFTVRIVAGSSEVGKVLHQPGDGWKGFELPLGRASGTTADVEFHVTAPPNGTHVCFEADSR
jgi:hypothetical protein